MAEGPLDGREEARALLLEDCHVKPHAAIGRDVCRTKSGKPMETQDRGLPLCKKEAQPGQGPTEAHCIPLWSGAQREVVQMQVEGSEGGMTSGAFSQNAHYAPVYVKPPGGRAEVVAVHLCAASVLGGRWARNDAGCCQSRGSSQWPAGSRRNCPTAKT